MEKQDPNHLAVSRNRLSRSARLQARLFVGLTVGTALVMAAQSGPKLPIGLGE